MEGTEVGDVDTERDGGDKDIDFGLSSSDCAGSGADARVGLLPGESSSMGERLLSRPEKFIPKLTESVGEYGSDTGDSGTGDPERSSSATFGGSSTSKGGCAASEMSTTGVGFSLTSVCTEQDVRSTSGSA